MTILFMFFLTNLVEKRKDGYLPDTTLNKTNFNINFEKCSSLTNQDESSLFVNLYLLIFFVHV